MVVLVVGDEGCYVEVGYVVVAIVVEDYGHCYYEGFFSVVCAWFAEV